MTIKVWTCLNLITGHTWRYSEVNRVMFLLSRFTQRNAYLSDKMTLISTGLIWVELYLVTGYELLSPRPRPTHGQQQLTWTIKSTICWLLRIIQSIENRITIKVSKTFPDHLEKRSAGDRVPKRRTLGSGYGKCLARHWDLEETGAWSSAILWADGLWGVRRNSVTPWWITSETYCLIHVLDLCLVIFFKLWRVETTFSLAWFKEGLHWLWFRVLVAWEFQFY